MTDRPPRGGSSSAEDYLPWLIVGAAAVVFLGFLGVWLGGTLGAAVSGSGWNPPPVRPHDPLLPGPGRLRPPSGRTPRRLP